MRVTGLDSLGQPFWERTATLVVNSHGCKFPSKQKLKTNSWVTLGVADRQANRLLYSVQARVVCVQPPETRQGLFHIAVELEVPGNVWGITLPPGDWLPFRKLSPLQSSTAVAEPSTTAQAPAASPASASDAELRNPSPLQISRATAKPPTTARAPAASPASVSDAEPTKVSPSVGVEVGTPSTRPVSEVQEQNQKMVLEAASAAVAAEASRVVGELRTQLQEEAQKIVEGMAAARTDQWVQRAAEKLYEAEQASARALHEQWSRKIDLDLRETSERLAARSAELNQMAESLSASTIEHVQGVLETTRRDSAARFVSRLQQQLAPLLAHAQEVLTKLEACKEPVEQTSQMHGDRFEETLQQSVLEAAARMQETSGQFEQAIRDRMTKALEELERKATATASVMVGGFHTICESCQREAHSSLQAALEQGVNRLREKAAEIARIFAAELDNYTQSNLEHARGSIAELSEEHPSRSRAART